MPTRLFRPQHAQVLIASVTGKGYWPTTPPGQNPIRTPSQIQTHKIQPWVRLSSDIPTSTNVVLTASCLEHYRAR